MNKQTEALKMAIEVMQRYLKETPLGNQPHMIAHKAEEAIQACKEALAQPAQEEKFCDANCVWTDHHPDCKLAQPAQEPVAVCKDSIVNWVNGKAIDGWLYTRPAPSCSYKDKK